MVEKHVWIVLKENMVMDKVFIDTNIMIDVLLGRKKFLAQSSNIFQLADSGAITLYATALSFVNALYIGRKELGKSEALKKLKLFHDFLNTAPMDEEELARAFMMDDKDFEDNLQYCSACSAGCNVIVTRNVKDFPKDGEVRVMMPSEFLDAFAEEVANDSAEINP
ncbi:PIN domain-containing protein [Prevotellaceae bacterium LKV-178-WT-2A]|uniref:PIN domain-containing protein n=2 Tax=Hallella mizrahii TaxID=2606637 RepID=A0A7K0KG96_9BACT|nr:PIN domain-containing protein [Hallella mizrahii]